MPFTQDALHDALRSMCPAALKAYDKPTTDAMRREWSADNPTRFCCYFVSEMVHWYAHIPTEPMSLIVHGDATLHRYLRTAHDMFVVDLTCDQFSGPLDYSNGKPKGFMQTGGPGPSRRARQLAERLNLSRQR